MTLNYSLASTDGDNKDDKNKQGERNGGRPDDLYGTNTDFSDRRDSQFDDDDNKVDKKDDKKKEDDFKFSFE